MELTLEQLIGECERRGLKIEQPPAYRDFIVTARFDRGLGAEYVTLKNVSARNINEAQELADAEASLYFKAEHDETTVINEIRIRPQ